MADRPPRPALILFAAIFPGVGHVMQGRPQRGLVFLFFIVVFAWLSMHVMPSTASFTGRHIGGIFIYGLSVLDAFRYSKIRWEQWKHVQDP
jgi:hypothetical protein